MACVRTVKTASGATAVQIVHSSRGGSRDIEHIGSAHDERELVVLKASARQRLAVGQGELELGLHDRAEVGGPLEITSSRAAVLWDALSHAYDVLGFDQACGGDEVFRQLVLARIIEPTSKLDSLRVIAEAGISPASYATLKRCLPGYATEQRQAALSAACAKHAELGPATLVLYDVSTLYYETDTGDGFREPGFSKERRLEPQIVIGLLTDPAGFPLLVNAFEGNTAETKTMLPVIEAFLAAHQVREVTIVADAGMISDANRKAIEDAGLSFILGMKIPKVPYVVDQWRQDHVDKDTGEVQDIPDGHIFTQPWPAGPTDKRRDQMIYYQYSADRARRTLRGIDQQVAKAERAVAGEISVKRNRFVKLSGGTKSVNQALATTTRALAGLKGYWTDLDPKTAGAEFVIGAYHRLYHAEKSFRMSKHDLQARPIYHRKIESIDAHLTIVFAALAVSHWVEARTGWSIKKFVRTARRYRTVNIRAGDQIITAADPLPDDLR